MAIELEGVLGSSSPAAIALFLLCCGIWVAALIHAARNESWGWFVVLFLFWPALLLYPLAMAGQRRTRKLQRNVALRRQQRHQELARKVADLQRELERSRKLAELGSKPAGPAGGARSG